MHSTNYSAISRTSSPSVTYLRFEVEINIDIDIKIKIKVGIQIWQLDGPIYSIKLARTQGTTNHLHSFTRPISAADTQHCSMAHGHARSSQEFGSRQSG